MDGVLGLTPSLTKGFGSRLRYSARGRHRDWCWGLWVGINRVERVERVELPRGDVKVWVSLLPTPL